MVVANLGADEEVWQVVPEAIANAYTQVLHEMIAASVVGAPWNATRAQQVETVAGNADSGLKIETKFLGQFRLKQCIGIRKDRAVVLIAVIAGLVIAPGRFNVKAEAGFSEADIVKADAGINATGIGRGMEIHGVANASEGFEEGSSGRDIELLG